MFNHNFKDIDVAEEKRKKLMVKTFAKNIRERRLTKGLTQEIVAANAGISTKYLQKIEKAKVSFSAVIACRLSHALDCPICKILPTTNGCPMNEDVREEIKKLFAGKEERDIQKALKILKAFFE